MESVLQSQRRLNSASGIEGTRQVQKHKSVTRFAPEYRSYVNRDDDMFTLEFGRSSSRRSSSRPMKKPLAEEMSNEPRRRTGVIARLVGFEGRSYPQRHRQPQSLSGRYQQQNAPISIQTDRHTYACRCNRRSSMDRQDLRDIYHDDQLMARIQHKYGRRDGSVELDVNPNRTRGRHISDLEPFSSAKYDGKTKAWKFERKDCLLLERYYYNNRALSSRQSSKIRSDEKNEKRIQRGNVFLLEPRRDYKHGYGAYSTGWKDSSCGVGFSYTVSNRARAKAYGVVKEMENGFDETIDPKYYRKNPFNSQTEWSIKEAKEILSEKWKKTSKYRELEIVGESKTTGKQTGPKLLNITRIDPLGATIRPRLKVAKHETVVKEKHMIRFEPIRIGRVKFAKRTRTYKKVYSSQGSKSKIKNPFRRELIYSNEIGFSAQAKFEIEFEPKVKDVSHMYRMVAKDIAYKKSVSEVTIVPPKASQLVPKETSPVVVNDKAVVLDQKESNLQESPKTSPEQGSSSLQCVLAEPNTPQGSNAADHASPVSVFEVPLTEDASSGSESFERVNAEINALRMQLQLLKKESSSNAEIKKEISELYSKLSEGSYISGIEAWEISYVLDVLVEAGLQETGFDTFITKWHLPDCPIDPLLFDDLEPRYTDENIELSQKRRVIFDRINWVLLEIFDQNVDFSPWVMPKLWELSCQKEKGATQSVENLIDQVFADENIKEKILCKEMLRPDFKEEIEEIGMKIEDLLMDEMMSEFI